MAEHFGFFDALETADGLYDRTYSARDLSLIHIYVVDILSTFKQIANIGNSIKGGKEKNW